LSLRDEPGQPDQVVGGAAEDEQPVHLFQLNELMTHHTRGYYQLLLSSFVVGRA
jgi:hypothetical protein